MAAQDYSALLREAVPILAGVAGAVTVRLLPDGTGAAWLSVANAIWNPQHHELPRYESDRQEVRRGTLTIDPTDAPGLTTHWRAEVNGVGYDIESLGHRAPLVDLELVRMNVSEIAQDQHRVKR